MIKIFILLGIPSSLARDHEHDNCLQRMVVDPILQEILDDLHQMTSVFTLQQD
jgi:hypothetical protein